MKKVFKRKWFWALIVVIIVIAIVIVVNLSNQGNLVEYKTEPVQSGNLIQTVTATGMVESARDIDLNFKTSGKLAYLNVDEGSVVKAGQVLARLDSAGLVAQVDQYQANLTSAEADLERVRAGASQEDIKVVEQKVSKAESDLQDLLVERDAQLQIYREKALNDINNAEFTAQVALDVVYNHFINDATTANLQTNNEGLGNDLQDDYYRITKNFNNIQTAVSSANIEKTNDAIILAIDAMRTILSDLNSFLNDAYSLGDSIILNTSYTQTNKDSIKSDISTQQSTNNTSLSSLQTAKANLVNNINSYQTQIRAGENNLSIYQAELELKKAGARDFEIQAAEAKVSQARAQLNKIVSDLSDYSITAPIDGKVTKVNFDLGEQTNLSEPAIKMLSVEQFEIQVDIPESDITKIKVGDKSVIELDAFGSDHLFSGTISFIDPAQTVIQDVTYYRTTVSFDSDSWNDQIKPGMTADVTITTAEKEGVLYIPQRAVKIRESVLGEVPQKFVEVLLDNNEVEEKDVEIGLRADDGLVEILSGLSEGENVVTFKKNSN